MHVDTQQATPALAATKHNLPLARASIVFGLLLFIAGMVFDLVVYPGIAADAGSALPIYIGVAGVIAGGYLAIAVGDTRHVTPAKALAIRSGLRWGVLVGGLWLIEVVAGNVFTTPTLADRIVYEVATTSAFLLPGIVSGLVAYQTGKVAMGIRASIWCGMIGALITAILGLQVIIQVTLLLGIGQHDPQNIQQFHTSHSHDLAGYIAGDALAGAINHLWLIGLVFSALVGGGGALIGNMLAGSSRTVSNGQ
jgi:hypothetical protein